MKKNQNKEKLLARFIENTPFIGWNIENLEKSCEELELGHDYHEIIFPAGLHDISQYISDECNKNSFKKLEKQDLNNLRISEKVEIALHTKIMEYHNFLGNKEALKKFLGYSIAPTNIGNSSKNIFNFSNDVWRMLEDKSTDFSYYTKRLSMSGIYSKAFLYSISDESPELENTRKFLKRTIDGLMKFHKLKSKVLNLLPNIGSR